DVSKVRALLRKRLMDEPRIVASQKALDHMLITLEKGGFVKLDPPQPPPGQPAEQASDGSPPVFVPPIATATATPELDKLLVFRSIHPLYGAFLVNQLGIADATERLQAMESVLEMPRPLLKFLRVPPPDQLPPGPLASTRLDGELVQRGLIAAPLAGDAED